MNKVNMNSVTHKILQFIGVDNRQKSRYEQSIETVNPEEMDFLFSLVDKNQIVKFSSFIHTGDQVKIVKGPLKGLEGKVVKVNSRKKRLKVEIRLLGDLHYVDLGGQMVTV